MAGQYSRGKEFIRALVPAGIELPAYNLLLNFKRRRRRGSGAGPIRVTAAGSAYDVTVGGETIRIPTLRRSQRYVNGIAEKQSGLAAKYGVPQFYAPRASDIVIDIGANVGEFSRHCARLGARVFAFEPDPAVFACLAHNVAQLPVTPIERALWSSEAELPFFSAFDTADSSLIQPEANVRAVATIKALPLDAVEALAGAGEIALLKMDGEGAEPEILAGARATMPRIRRIAVDCSPERAGEDTATPVIALLTREGYRIVSKPGSKLVFAER